MPYRNTYGFPPYDPEKPMGGWDAETWQRYRQQQDYRAPNKTDRLARNKTRADRKRQATIAAIDKTLAQNPLGTPPKAAPDGRKSGAQIRYEQAQRRREQLQAQRDRLAAELKRAPARPFSDQKQPPATTTTSAPANQVPAPTAMDGGPMTAAQMRANGITPPTPAKVPTAYAPRPANTPPPNLPATGGGPGPKRTKGAPAQPAYNATARNYDPVPVAKTPKPAPLPAAGRADWKTEARKKGMDVGVIQQRVGWVAKEAKRMMGHTPASGKGKDESAPKPKPKK